MFKKKMMNGVASYLENCCIKVLNINSLFLFVLYIKMVKGGLQWKVFCATLPPICCYIQLI